MSFVNAGYSMAIGQALIPIPIVGGAVGALVGTALTSSLYRNLISQLKGNELEEQRREQIIENVEKWQLKQKHIGKGTGKNNGITFQGSKRLL